MGAVARRPASPGATPDAVAAARVVVALSLPLRSPLRGEHRAGSASAGGAGSRATRLRRALAVTDRPPAGGGSPREPPRPGGGRSIGNRGDDHRCGPVGG